MTNADRITHPIIPQRNQYVTVEYLKSLGIDENFKVSTITLTNPTIKESAIIASQDNSDRITITQNISEFTSHGYVSSVNNLTVSTSIMIMQNIIISDPPTPLQSIVSASCNITKLEETCKMTINRVDYAQIDEITCNVSSQSITIHVKANSSYPILGSGVLSITVEFGNKTAHTLTFGNNSFNITPLQIF